MSELTNEITSQPVAGEPLLSLKWNEQSLLLLDQRLLPEDIVFLELTTSQEVWEAIHSMKVRGAPAIGIAAAYGVVLGAINEDAAAETH